MQTAFEYLKSLKVVSREEIDKVLANCSKRHKKCFHCLSKPECKQLYDEYFCDMEDVVMEGKHSAEREKV